MFDKHPCPLVSPAILSWHVPQFTRTIKPERRGTIKGRPGIGWGVAGINILTAPPPLYVRPANAAPALPSWRPASHNTAHAHQTGLGARLKYQQLWSDYLICSAPTSGVLFSASLSEEGLRQHYVSENNQKSREDSQKKESRYIFKFYEFFLQQSIALPTKKAKVSMTFLKCKLV